MTRNPEWERAREACVHAVALTHKGDAEFYDTGVRDALAALRALPVPEPAPDPRDAEIARLQEALTHAQKIADFWYNAWGRANAALVRSVP